MGKLDKILIAVILIDIFICLLLLNVTIAKLYKIDAHILNLNETIKSQIIFKNENSVTNGL